MKQKKVYLAVAVWKGGLLSSIFAFSSYRKASAYCNHLNEILGHVEFIVKSKTIQ